MGIVTGNTHLMSVHNILERANELRRARGVSEVELFDSTIDWFSGLLVGSAPIVIVFLTGAHCRHF